MKNNKLFILFVLALFCIPLISSPSSALNERSFTITYTSGTSLELSLSLDSLLLDTAFIPMEITITVLNLNPHIISITDIVVKVRFSKSPDTHSTLSIVYLNSFSYSSYNTPSILYYDKSWGSSRLEAYIEWNEPSYHIYSEWMNFFTVRPNNLYNRYSYIFTPVIVVVSVLPSSFLFFRYLKKRRLALQTPPPSFTCSDCNIVLEPDSKFCAHCGKKL